MRTGTRGAVAVVAAVVVLASVTPFALVGTVAAATHTVDDDGGADYTTIQAAVDAASPGDTIQVAPGTYEESVIVDKPLTLVGDPGDGAAGAGDDAPVVANGPEMYGFKVTGGPDGTTITGFDVRGYSDAAVTVNLRTGNTLADFELSHNDFSDNEVEFELFGPSDVTLDGVDVTSNRFVDSGGMEVDDAGVDGLTVTGFTFADNEMQGSIGDAVTVDMMSTNTDATMAFRGNTIHGSSNDGIKFYLNTDESYDFTVTENVIDGSADDAIDFYQNGGNALTVRIEDNELRGSGDKALAVRNGVATGFTVRQNDIVDNQAGIENGGEGIVDARNNYWGASDGPSSATGTLADPVDESVLADGAGDSVSEDPSNPGVSNVRFAPFETRPIGTPPASTGAQFELGDASFSTSNAVVGQPVTISVPVTNEGDSAGTFRGMLRSDFTGHDSVERTLAAGETATIRTTVVYGDVGSYNVRLADEYVGSLTVSPRDPMSVTVDADPANNTVDATVENPRRTAIDVSMPPVNATNDTGVALTSVQVTPDTIDDFQFSVTQTHVGTTSVTDDANATNTTDDANATNSSVMVLPDGTVPVSSLSFDSSLEDDEIESVQLTFTVNTTRYPSLADATAGETVPVYRYDATTDTFTRMSAEVVETSDGSLTATASLDGFSTYMIGVDRAAFDVSTSVTGNPVDAGDSLSLVFDVTNTGDGPGAYAPTVALAGEPVESERLVLAGGETGTLVVDLQTSAPGVWPITADGKLVAIAFVEPDDAE